MRRNRRAASGSDARSAGAAFRSRSDGLGDERAAGSAGAPPAVKEHLFDGGFVNKDLTTEAESCGAAIHAPLPKNRQGEPCTHGRNDSADVAAWRRRMMTPGATPTDPDPATRATLSEGKNSA